MLFFKGMPYKLLERLIRTPPYASRIGHFVESIKHELVLFRSSCVVYAPRETNIAAHNLAKEVVSSQLNVVWLEGIPNYIHNIVLREQVVPKS